MKRGPKPKGGAAKKYTDFQMSKVGFLLNPDRKGRYYHLRRLIGLVWNDSNIAWNPWLEDQLKSLTDDKHLHKIGNTTVRFVAWTGPGASGKTFASGLYAMSWFMASPENSCVTLTSTSKSAMGGRVWAVIKDLFADGYDPDTGYPFDWHIVNSRKILQWPAGDEKHNIACFAVEEGELMKSVDKIKGRHTERMLLIVDEANGTPEAIFNVIPNMLKGCKELVVLVFDNAGDMYGNHGRCCEPKAGWESVSVDSESWETKGVQDWGLPPGLCKHYDGQKSPNVLAGKTIYPHIYSWENWQTALKHPTDSIHFWSQDRGYWAPSGTSTTVFSAPLISRCDGAGFNPIHNNREVYAFLDPGFGGDRCCAQFAEVGVTEAGLFVIQIGTPIYIEPRINNEAERDYQIANQFAEECRHRGVNPDNAGTDATAIGRGVYAILAANWSMSVKRVEWGGRASDKPSSRIDGRPAHEIYGDRVTELWFSVRDFMEAGQLKGLYPEAIKQACSRQYTISGRRYFLNTKRECKAALGYSPDEMDAIAGLVEVVRMNGFIAQTKIVNSPDVGWDRFRQEAEKNLALVDAVAPGQDNGGWAEKDFGIEWSEYGN